MASTYNGNGRKAMSTLKIIGVVMGTIGSLTLAFFTIVAPTVESKVNAKVREERIIIDQEITQQRVERMQQLKENQAEHKDVEDRIGKRLDRIETKVDTLLERGSEKHARATTK